MTTLGALQTTLAGEHAALYVYGALGAQTSQSRSAGLFAAVTDAYTVHRARRDHLVGEILEQQATPVAAAPAYDLPAGLGSARAVTTTARELEKACAATYAFLVANTGDAERAWAIGALTDAAVRSLAFGGEPQDLPGT